VSPPYARKRFGQHYLVDEEVIDQIVALIATRPTDQLIEIGPGRGALTAPLARLGGRLTVIEVDRELGAIIERNFGHQTGFTIHIEDALKVDYPSLIDAGSVRVVGNLPYNISTPLILKLMDQQMAIDDMTFMLQKEVVDRLAATPGTKAYGRLSVIVQSKGRVEPFFEVPPLAFAPPPKVTSKLVRITPQSGALSPLQREHLESSVRIAFGQRRKTIKNTLGKMVEHDVLQDCGISLKERPEDITVACYVRLAQALAGR
jgi:16S rRNA (adenine1518-N6/adenine1519-N6)-dimethyltransferase